MQCDFLHTCSLRTKILGILFVVLALFIGAVLYGVWHYQQDKMVSIHRRNAQEIGLTVEASLRDAMLREDRNTIQTIINEISSISTLSQISLVNNESRIVLSSDPSLPGRVFNKKTDKSCLPCHDKDNAQNNSPVIELNTPNGPILRSIIKIINTPACYKCHPGSQKVNGLLLVDSSLSDIYSILRTIAQRIVITGILTYLAIICLISILVTRFVSRPVQKIMNGIKEVEEGKFDSWVEVDAGGEFSDMAVSFNVMKRAIVRYLNEVKVKNDEIATLYTIVQRMSETIDLKKVKSIVANLLSEIFKAENVVLVLPIEQNRKLFEITWKRRNERHNHTRYSLELEEPPHPSLSKEELTRWLNEECSEPVFVDQDKRVLIPLHLKDMKLALLAVDKGANEQFRQAEKKIIPALTHHIAISLANAHLYTLAITDELTGLYTKRYFQNKIREFEEHYQVTGTGFCVMMIDLDFFKRVNDQYGHPIGDLLLADVARIIRGSLRQGDIPCRFGGEEFIILLPDFEIQAARMIAERLHSLVAEHTFQYPDTPAIRQTISIGLSCCPAHATESDELVMIADSALYEAKHAGRNQIFVPPADRDRK